jgi:hypothetical protein
MLSDSKQARKVMKDIGDKVADVGVGVEGVSNKVEDIDEKVKSVDEKVQVVIDGARAGSTQLLNLLTSILSDGKQVRVAAQETSLVLQQAANDMDEIKCSWLPNLAIVRSSCLNSLTGNQFIQLLRSWLSPLIRPRITTLHERLNTTERQRGSFKARSSSNGSL